MRKGRVYFITWHGAKLHSENSPNPDLRWAKRSLTAMTANEVQTKKPKKAQNGFGTRVLARKAITELTRHDA